MQAIGTVKTIKDIYDDLKDWKKKNDFKNMFHEHAVKQIGYIGDKKSKSDTEVLLGTLFSDANKKTIENIALNTAPIKLIEVIFGFLEEEKESLCLNDASTNNTEFLDKHISIYIANIKEEIDKSYPEISNELYISEKFEDIIKIGKEILLAVNKQSKTDSSTRLNNDVKLETVSLAKVSEITEASMEKAFNGYACFEKNIYENLNKNYKRVKTNSVYQEPDCVYFDCGNSELKDKLRTYNVEFFNNEFQNYNKNEKSKISKVDKFYRKNKNKVLNVIKAFIEAKVYRDYNSKILFNEHDKVPTTCYIYGEAGIGKTTLTGRMSNDYSDITDKKIYFVRVKELKIENEKLLYNDKVLDFSCLNDNDVLWLDGLDEGIYSGSECVTLSKIKQLIKKNIRIIITSRLGYGVIDEDSIAIKISPFDEEKIKSYVESYFPEDVLVREHGYNDIISVIEDDDKLYKDYRILTIPLILYMFIYNNIMKSMTEKGGIETGEQFSEMQLYDDLLGKNSYIFKNKVYDNGAALVEHKRLKDYREEAKKNAFDMFRMKSLRIEKVMTNEEKDIRVFDFYLSRYEGSGNNKYNIEFFHKSFYEYFIAEKLLDEVLRSAQEGEDFRKILNKYLGINRIDEYIFKFIEFMMNKSIGRKLRKVKEDLQDNLITFTKEFCIGVNYFENKKYYKYLVMQDIACNTFANFTGILLKLFDTTSNQASDIFKIADSKIKDYEKICKNIKDFFRINEEYINLIKLDFTINNKEGEFYFPDFSSAQLSDAELREADLRRVILDGANLRGANLRGAIMSGIKLHDADLRKADLKSANLSEANFSGANLRGADLSRTDLRRANLRKINISEADLSGADLRRADLREVDLSGAELIEANLSGTNLSGANLIGTIMFEADLSGSDLSYAKLYRSVLNGVNFRKDLREVYLSGAKVREANFRGCKLSDEQRQYIKENGGIVDKEDEL